jgi:hypothetical protein
VKQLYEEVKLNNTNIRQLITAMKELIETIRDHKGEMAASSEVIRDHKQASERLVTAVEKLQ